MEIKELPYAIAKKVTEWTNPERLHFWERDGTYFVVATCNTNILCLRLWESSSGEIQLSQDNILYM